MIVLARQDPLLYPGRYGYPRSSDGIAREEVPLIECDSLLIRGDFKLETAEGWKPTSQVRKGEEIIFYPERIQGFGGGFKIRSGDTLRTMSPSEFWALGVGWLTPGSVGLVWLSELTDLEREHESVLDAKGMFIGAGLRTLYEGVALMDTHQMKALLRGCLFAVSTWETGWSYWTADEQRTLSQRINSPLGRFLAHMGLIMNHRHQVMPRLRSSLISRLKNTEEEVMHYDVTTLKVTAVRTTKLKSTCVAHGTGARLLGLAVQGLDYGRKL